MSEISIITPDQLADEVASLFDRETVLGPLRDAVRNQPDRYKRMAALRELYGAHDPGEDWEYYDPYEIGADRWWTPIEVALWHDVRTGGLHMVPEFPVGRYFLDFANPVRKIAVEADGARWHDAARDKVRDTILWEQYGWRVFRLSGRQCLTDYDPPSTWLFEQRDGGTYPTELEVHEYTKRYWLDSAAGLCKAIRIAFYGYGAAYDDRVWAEAALLEHHLADFPVPELDQA